MLERTQKRVGQGRETEVGDGRRGIRRGEWGWYLPTLTACDRVSYYILHCCLWVVRYMTMCTCIILIVNLQTENGPVHVGKEHEQMKQHYNVTSSQKLY